MIETILKSYLKNLIYLSIIFKIFILNCKTTEKISLSEKNYILNHPIFFIENLNQYDNILSFKNLIKYKDSISDDQWTFHAIWFYHQNEIFYAEYCFIEAISHSNQTNSPYPLELNKTLKSYLNLLFFYELLKINHHDIFLEKRNESLKQYVDLIQNREDLALVTIQEIRKRNFSKLEQDFVDQFYRIRNIHSESFIYEYIITHIHNHKIYSKNLNDYFKIINQIKTSTIKESLLQQLGYYFYYKKDFEVYIKIYETHQNLLKSKIDSSSNIFYIENLFNAYVNLYKKNFQPVPEEIYNKIINQKYVNENTYRLFLEYYYEAKLLYSNDLDYKKIKIQPLCKETSIFFIMCPSLYLIKELTIQKEIFGTNDFDKINQIKEFIINLN